MGSLTPLWTHGRPRREREVDLRERSKNLTIAATAQKSAMPSFAPWKCCAMHEWQVRGSLSAAWNASASGRYGPTVQILQGCWFFL